MPKSNKTLLITLITLLTLISSVAYKQINKDQKNTSETPPQKTSCGGWDTYSQTICECSGELELYTCPTGTECDSGTHICHGTCGGCKCYTGPNQIETPCNNNDYGK